MSELPKIVRARLQVRPAEAHPDPDVLTAFYEQALPEKEREPVLAHLAECSECRDVVGIALPAVEETHVRAAVPASAWGWPQMVRWGSVVACLVVVGAAVLIRHPGTPEVVRPKSEVDVMDRRDAVSAVAEQKAPVVPEAAPAQSPRANALQNKVPALPNKVITTPPVSAQPKRIEPSAMSAKKAAVDHPLGQILDKRAGVEAVGAETREASGARTALARALPAPVPPTMKSETVKVAADQTAVAVAPSASTPDLRPAETPGRAKVGAVGAANEAAAPESSGSILADSFGKEAQASPAGVPASAMKMPAQFELSPEGQLQRSFDSGKSWQPVPLVDRVKFNALAVMGPEVWVGGVAGLLYHSADNGQQWKPVKPSVGGVALAADIMNVRFTDMQHLAVITSDGQVWTTSDGGQNWQRNR